MAEKIKSCMEIKERTPLQEVIPLNTPFSVQIELSSVCNFKCKFCINGDKEALSKVSFQRGLIKPKTYKKVIDDLKGFNDNVKVLLLNGTGESLLDKHIGEKISYAKKSNKVDRIHLISNAALLTNEKSLTLIESGLDRLVISLYGVSSDQIYKMTGVQLDFEEYVKNIAYLYSIKGNCEVIIKYFDNAFTKEEKAKCIELFSPISDFLYVDNMYDIWPDHETDSSMYNGSNNNTQSPQVCSPLFYSLLVNSDGTCPLCCVDWKHDYNIGDANTHSLVEIWNSQKLFRYQRLHLEGNKDSIPICKDCKDLREGQRDNIDEFREEMLIKFLQKKGIEK